MMIHVKISFNKVKLKLFKYFSNFFIMFDILFEKSCKLFPQLSEFKYVFKKIIIDCGIIRICKNLRKKSRRKKN